MSEKGDPVGLVALRTAARNGFGFGPGVQEGEEVFGVLAGRVQAEVEVDGPVALRDRLESVVQFLIARRGPFELASEGGGLPLGAQEGSMMPVARGVDTDAEGRAGWRGGERCG
jgi:hypothetical protein